MACVVRSSDWSSDVCSSDLVQGDWCFVAGTTGYDPETRAMPEDVRDQAKNALAIVEKALAEGGFQLADVVRATYYITDMVYWDAIGPVLGKIFGDIRDRKRTRLKSSH